MVKVVVVVVVGGVLRLSFEHSKREEGAIKIKQVGTRGEGRGFGHFVIT